MNQETKPQMACGRRKGVKGLLGMAACCGAPIAAGLLLASFGGYLGSVGTAAGAALPYLALLACPLGMYFMMRFMMRPEPTAAPQGLPVDAQAEVLSAEIVPQNPPLPPVAEQSQPLLLPPKGDEDFNGQKKQESRVLVRLGGPSKDSIDRPARKAKD